MDELWLNKTTYLFTIYLQPIGLFSQTQCLTFGESFSCVASTKGKFWSKLDFINVISKAPFTSA